MLVPNCDWDGTYVKWFFGDYPDINFSELLFHKLLDVENGETDDLFLFDPEFEKLIYP